MQLNKIVENKLEALHKDAEKDYLRVGRGIVKSMFGGPQPSDFEKAYLTISKSQGRNLHKMIVDHKCKNIVEFGTSFGISTLYLAEAARETGGMVISTELLPSKAEIAKTNIASAGLEDYVEIKTGDAMQTLSTYSDPIDFLFLDGWKSLYLPLFNLLEPNFHHGTLIYADNMDMRGTESYANYLINNNSTFSNKVVDQGKAFLTTVL